MSTQHRVAITGMGAITSLGHSIPQIWDNIIQGKNGIRTIQNVDMGEVPVKIAGEINDFHISEDILDFKEARRYDTFIHYALHSAFEAAADSGLSEAGYDPTRIGCILGVGMGGFPMISEVHSTFINRGHRRISPFFIPGIIPNMASGLISIKMGLKGVNYTIASACASSAHALSSGFSEIQSGRHEVMLAGGCESVISQLTIAGFGVMKALSKNNEHPEKASRPFDKDRDGFVMGEGAGILVLENYDKAKARGAKIYAEVVGNGLTSDAHHITAPHPEGEGAYRCMKQAVEEAGISHEAVGYINAHGTSTPLGDLGETMAIKKLFGDHAYKLYVSSTKSMIGHLLGAAGGIESIFCVKALETGIIPPTINIDNQDPECDLNYVANKAIESKVEFALNNSFGFGGTNSSIIFKRH